MSFWTSLSQQKFSRYLKSLMAFIIICLVILAGLSFYKNTIIYKHTFSAASATGGYTVNSFLTTLTQGETLDTSYFVSLGADAHDNILIVKTDDVNTTAWSGYGDLIRYGQGAPNHPQSSGTIFFRPTIPSTVNSVYSNTEKPLPLGNYILEYRLASSSFSVIAATSKPFRVIAPISGYHVASTINRFINTSTVNAGDSMPVSLVIDPNIPVPAGSYIGVYRIDDPTTPPATFPLPATPASLISQSITGHIVLTTPGTYEVRYMLSNGQAAAIGTETVTVTVPDPHYSVIPNPNPASRTTLFTPSFKIIGGLLAHRDNLEVVNIDNGAIAVWSGWGDLARYSLDGKSSGTLSFNLTQRDPLSGIYSPIPAGTYVVRYYTDTGGGFVPVAYSQPFQVVQPDSKLVVLVPGVGNETNDGVDFADVKKEVQKDMNPNVDSVQYYTYPSQTERIDDSANNLNTFLNTAHADKFNKVYIITHSYGHLVTRRAVLNAASDPILSAVYKKTKIYSISPILGGAYGASYIPLFLNSLIKWGEVNPLGNYQRNLFSKTNVALFNAAIAGYSSFTISGNPSSSLKIDKGDYHLEGIWRSIVDKSGTQMLGKGSCLKSYYSNKDIENIWYPDYLRGRGNPHIEYYLISRLCDPNTVAKPLDTSYISIVATQSSDWTHVMLLHYPPLLQSIMKEIFTISTANLK